LIPTGIVHRDKDGVFWFDDVPVRDKRDVPRSRAWVGTTWYAPQGVKAVEWSSIMSPQDLAFGPRPGVMAGVSFNVKRGRMKVLSASTWGVDAKDPNRCWNELAKLYVQAKACDLSVRSSAAGTAVGIYLERFDGQNKHHPSLRQLPCRWRGMAHAALHGGPIGVLRASSPNAYHVDVHRAYLKALRAPMPVVGSHDDRKVGGWYTTDDERWETVRTLHGFVDASVRVWGPDDPAGLPPLPVHTWGGAMYARGTIRGCWLISEVRAAEERGEVEVLKVHEYAFAPTVAPLFAPLADLFESLPQPLGKRLYTRFWGRLGTRGGFSARVSDEPVEGMVPSSGLWWNWDGIDFWSHKAPRTYRPDLASFVCGENHRAVIAATRKLAHGSILGLHVDAIWTDDLKGADAMCGDDIAGNWRVKKRGPLRFYGIGCYDHDGKLAASGYDSSVYGRLTPERQVDWIRGATIPHHKTVMRTREWTADLAWDDTATSTPLTVNMDTERSPVTGPGVHEDCWSLGGWYRGPIPGEPDPPAEDAGAAA